MQNELSMKFVA